MGQTWESLLFAHWRVDADLLRRAVPKQIPLDTFDGSAWIGITPFRVTGMRVRPAPPLPGSARFPEVNVRTYTTVEGRPGIWFLSLDTPNRLAVQAARRAYRVPYFRAQVQMQHRAGRIRFRSERIDPGGPRAAVDVDYGPKGSVNEASPGSFEHWAIERYCLYALDADERVLRGEIHHPPWQLRGAEAAFLRNTMGHEAGRDLTTEPVLHFAERQDVVFWLNAAI
jgi:uncharacterized protein YqjF (DUF2071 family)